MVLMVLMGTFKSASVLLKRLVGAMFDATTKLLSFFSCVLSAVHDRKTTTHLHVRNGYAKAHALTLNDSI